MSTETSDRHSDSGRAPSGTPAVSRSTACARVIALGVVGALAAVVAHFAISRMTNVFQLPTELATLGRGQIPGAEDQRRIMAAKLVVFTRHSALWLGTAGLVLGGATGLALGLFRRSAGSLWCGAVGGALAGGLAGSAAGPMAVYLERQMTSRLASDQSGLSDHQLMLMHASTWLVLGLGVGLGVGFGARERRGRSAAAAMLTAGVAGLIGGVLYLFLAGVAVPLADPSLPVPTGDMNRLLWLGLPSILIGLTLGRRSQVEKRPHVLA
jgi:hypothetical protein